MYKRLGYDNKGLYQANKWLKIVKHNIKKEKKQRRNREEESFV
jgi:hypothetical protein